MTKFTTKKKNYNVLLQGSLGMVSFHNGTFETKDSRIISALRKFPSYGTAFTEVNETESK